MTKSRGVAILVGAGDAIGAAVARRFARGGYAVCICRRDAAKSQALVDELNAEGQEIYAFSVDARQEKEVPGAGAELDLRVAGAIREHDEAVSRIDRTGLAARANHNARAGFGARGRAVAARRVGREERRSSRRGALGIDREAYLGFGKAIAAVVEHGRSA